MSDARESEPRGSLLSGNLALVVAAAIPTILAVVFTSMSRLLTWDEAVYHARATLNPSWERLWGPSRSLGMPVVLAPYTSFLDSVAGLRVWLGFVSISTSVVALRWWRRLAGPGIVVSFALVALSWQAGWYSATAYPNWLTGLLAFALAGWTVCVLSDEKASRVAGFVVAFLSFQMRLTDAAAIWGVVLVVALWTRVAGGPRDRVAAVVSSWREWLGRLAPALAGAAVSVTVWVVESEMYFGSVLERLRFLNDASQWERFVLAQYGQILWFFRDVPDGRGVLNILPLAYFAALVVLVAWGLAAVTSTVRRLLLPAFLGGVAITAIYVVSPGDSLQRFIIPGLVMLSVPAGFGARRAVRSLKDGSRLSRLLSGGVLAMFTVGVAGNASMLVHIDSRLGSSENLYDDVAARMDEIADGRECRFAAQVSYPQIQVYTPCAGTRAKFNRASTRPSEEMLDAPVSFLVGKDEPSAAWIEAGWTLDSVIGGWTLWVRTSTP